MNEVVKRKTIKVNEEKDMNESMNMKMNITDYFAGEKQFCVGLSKLKVKRNDFFLMSEKLYLNFFSNEQKHQNYHL